MESEKKPAIRILRIEWKGELTVEQVAQLKRELAEALEIAERLTVDLSEAERMDVSCLQLLCSAHRTASAMNKTLELVGRVREGFSKAMKSSGFLRHVGCELDCGNNCIWIDEAMFPQDAGTSMC